MRTHNRAVAAAACVIIALAGPAPAHAADPPPDPVKLQQSVPAVKSLLSKAGLTMRPAAEVKPTTVDAELKARPATVLAPTDCGAPTALAESRFTGFDTEVKKMMTDWGFMSAGLAVSNQCGVLYDQGYGTVGPWWARNAPAGNILDMGPETPDDALYRIASVTKPITAAAIHDLDVRGKLDKDDRVFCVPGGSTDCILTLPLPAKFDKRIGDMTVQHLIGHRGGFDRDVQTDYLFRAWEVYQARKLNAPPTARDFATYMLSLGLDFAPGSKSAYSNLGYLILGLVIEKLSGQSYRDYVFQRVLAPAGVTAGDVVLSRTKRLTRSTREPAYWCIDKDWAGRSPISTFPGEVGQRRCWADGGWVLEAMAAHGGLSMSAKAVALFYAKWWNFGTPRTAATYWNFPAGTTVSYGHNGRLAATQTIATRCVNGLNIALLTNQHAWGTFDSGDAEKRLCKAADALLAQGPRYATIWVKDGKAWRSHHATPAANYQALVDKNKADGYRLVDVNGYVNRGTTAYASTWVKDKAGFAASHGHTFEQFTATFNKYKGTGYRLDRISAWWDTGKPLYASVWVPNPKKSAWVSHIRMTAPEYQAKFDEYGKKGYRLVSVDGYEMAGQARYAAVWVQEPRTVRAIHGANAAQFQAWFDKAVKDGYRLTDRDTYTVGAGVQLAGVATKDGGPAFRAFNDWSYYSYQAKWAEQKAAGYRPITTAGFR